jgi:hypothetical protein
MPCLGCPVCTDLYMLGAPCPTLACVECRDRPMAAGLCPRHYAIGQERRRHAARIAELEAMR